MDTSLNNRADILDAFSASLITRLSDMGTDVRQYLKAVIELRTLPMAERDGGEINRLEEARGEIEKECNFYQTEMGEYLSNFINVMIPQYVAQICEFQGEYREILYKMDIPAAAGLEVEGYPGRSMDSYLTDFSVETMDLMNSFKRETLPKFRADATQFVQDLLTSMVGNGNEFSLVTLLKRDEPMATFETISSSFETEIAGQIASINAIKEGLSTLVQRYTEIEAAFNQFRDNPVPLDI